MGTDAEVLERLPYQRPIQVHHLMCKEVVKLVERISGILPSIEAARPRCMAGKNELCSVNLALDKANDLLHKCRDSSRLYLAYTGDTVLKRCETLRNSFLKSLKQIYDMVPSPLALEIYQLIEELRNVKFTLDPFEEEAGKAVKTMIHLAAADPNISEETKRNIIEALQHAALRLHMTSRPALLAERRAISRQLKEIDPSDARKKSNIKYLYYVVKTYEKSIVGLKDEHCVLHRAESLSSRKPESNQVYDEVVEVESRPKNEAQPDMLNRPISREEFVCPLSKRLMYDPVVIASGQTFERMWIQKYFEGGNITCPKTGENLEHLSVTPNVFMKNLISNWCNELGVTIPDPHAQLSDLDSLDTSSTSIASFATSMADLNLNMDLSNMSLGSLDMSYGSDMNTSNLMPLQMRGIYRNVNENDDSGFLSKLGSLAWYSQLEAVEGFVTHLEDSDEAIVSLSSENFIEPLIKFLENSRDKCDVKGQKSGSRLLLVFVTKSNNEIRLLGENAYDLLASFLNSDMVEEALAITEVLSDHKECRPKILASNALTPVIKFLDTETSKSHAIAMKILNNFSSTRNTATHIISLQCIPKLVPFLKNTDLARHSISILKNLCENTEEARVFVAENEVCLASVVELLGFEGHEEQENALSVLLSLCSQRTQFCELVKNIDSVFPHLVFISANGNNKEKALAHELIRHLASQNNDVKQSSGSAQLVAIKPSETPIQVNKPSPKSSGFFGRFRKKN